MRLFCRFEISQNVEKTICLEAHLTGAPRDVTRDSPDPTNTDTRGGVPYEYIYVFTRTHAHVYMYTSKKLEARVSVHSAYAFSVFVFSRFLELL